MHAQVVVPKRYYSSGLLSIWLAARLNALVVTRSRLGPLWNHLARHLESLTTADLPWRLAGGMPP